MSKIAVAAIALFMICTRPVPVDAVPTPVVKAPAQSRLSLDEAAQPLDQIGGSDSDDEQSWCWRPPSRNMGVANRNIAAELPCDVLKERRRFLDMR